MAKKLHHIEIHISDPRDGKFHGAEVQHHFEREVAHGSEQEAMHRCTTSGTLPVGALTIATANCGASAATALTIN